MNITCVQERFEKDHIEIVASDLNGKVDSNNTLLGLVMGQSLRQGRVRVSADRQSEPNQIGHNRNQHIGLVRDHNLIVA